MKKQDPIIEEIRALRGFRLHVSLYILLVGAMWIGWFLQGGMDIHPWPIYPTIAWGLILLVHYLAAWSYYRHKEKEESDSDRSLSV